MYSIFFEVPLKLFSKFLNSFCCPLDDSHCRLLARLLLLGDYLCKLLLFVYLLLAHLELLLLHTVVGYPELDAEPYKG